MDEATFQAILNDERRVRPFQLVLSVLLILLWDGLPFAMLGLDRSLGMHATSSMLLLGLAYYTLLFIGGRQRIDIWVVVPMLMSIAMLFSTIVSSLFHFINPPSSWIPALSNYSPVLLIFFTRAFDIRISEMLAGLLASSTLSAMLVMIDHFHEIPFMTQYITYSGFDAGNRRILMLKNDVAFGFLIAFARLVMARKPIWVIIYAIILSIIGFDLVVVMEARLVIGAVLLALIAFVAFSLPLKKRLLVGALGISLLVATGPIVFGKYIERIEGTQDYSDDSSVRWRLITVQHYSKYFDESSWVGFGIMSTSKDKASNILTYSYYEASKAYGDTAGLWGVYIADASLYGVLYQFGFPGLILALILTFVGALRLISFRVQGARFEKDLNAYGFGVLFLVINPWPLNIFGLSWAIMSGYFMWCTAARASGLARAAKQVTA